MKYKYAVMSSVLGAMCYLLGLLLAEHLPASLIGTLIVGLFAFMLGAEFEKADK